MAEDIVVVGGGGFGRETLDVIEAVNAAGATPSWNVLGVLDDDPNATALDQLSKRGYVHLGAVDAARAAYSPSHFVVGVGRPRLREMLAAKFEACGWIAATLIHPAAVLGSTTEVGDGAVVCGGVQLSTNTRLGRHVHLNPGAIVGHDTVIGDWVSINPGAVLSGEVEVGEATLVGASAVVLQGLRVGADVVVGAGACVTRNVRAHTTVVGIPARPLSEKGEA